MDDILRVGGGCLGNERLSCRQTPYQTRRFYDFEITVVVYHRHEDGAQQLADLWFWRQRESPIPEPATDSRRGGPPAAQRHGHEIELPQETGCSSGSCVDFVAALLHWLCCVHGRYEQLGLIEMAAHW